MAFPYKDIGTAMVNQGKSPFCPVYFFQQYINTEVREDQRDGISASFLQLPSQGPTISAQRPPQLQWSSWYSSVLNWKDFSSLNFFGVCNLSLLPHMVTQLNFIQLPYLAVVDMKVKFMKCQTELFPFWKHFSPFDIGPIGFIITLAFLVLVPNLSSFLIFWPGVMLYWTELKS